jgi:hypothetical protein
MRKFFCCIRVSLDLQTEEDVRCTWYICLSIFILKGVNWVRFVTCGLSALSAYRNSCCSIRFLCNIFRRLHNLKGSISSRNYIKSLVMRTYTCRNTYSKLTCAWNIQFRIVAVKMTQNLARDTFSIAKHHKFPEKDGTINLSR